MDILSKFNQLYTDLSSLNLSELEAVYDENVRFVDPVSTHVGIESVKQYFSNLLINTTSCRFTIHHLAPCGHVEQNQDFEFDHFLTWTMYLSTPRLNRGRSVVLEGTSFIAIENNRIVRQKDYYDMGQMVYEHLPVLGRLIKKIKHRLKVQ